MTEIFLNRGEIYRLFRLIVITGMMLTLAGCGSGKKEVTIRVFAASSLMEPLQSIIGDWERKSGEGVELNLASSAVLARQIETGARPDLFISAGGTWVEYLAAKGLEIETERWLRNDLVIALPVQSGLLISNPTDILEPEIRLIATGDPASVPLGRFARETFERLGLWEEVKSKLVGAMNAAAARRLVENGKVDCGILYRSDVTNNPRLKEAIRFTGESVPEVLYYRAILSENPKVLALVSFIESKENREKFEKEGFEVVWR